MHPVNAIRTLADSRPRAALLCNAALPTVCCALTQERADKWAAGGMPEAAPVCTTTWAELLEHCCGPRQPGESDEEYRQRAQHKLGDRSEPLPPPPPSKHLDGQTDDYYDSGAEDIWCMSCSERLQ